MTICFFVPGTPAPQGSKSQTRTGRMYEASSKALRPWRNDVAFMAKKVASQEQCWLKGAVCVEVEFRFKRPKSLPKKVQHHTRKPDLDKLQRAIGDALTISGLIEDDSCIAEWRCRKVYAEQGKHSGANITIWEIA